MTESRLDQLTSITITQQVDGEPTFLLSITSEGTVERMGYSAVHNRERTVAVVEDASIFERFLAGLPGDVLDHAGSHEAAGLAGARVVCRIELVGASDTTVYELTYSSESGGLSRYMRLMVDMGEDLTDEWYGGTLTLTPVLDLPPVQMRSPSAPAPPAPAAYEPPPPPPPAYEPPPWPAYEPPAEEGPEPEPDVEAERDLGEASDAVAEREVEAEADAVAEQEVEAGGERGRASPADTPRPTSPTTAPRTASRPSADAPATASTQRLALAVLLDLLLITGAYGIVTLMLGRALPLGAALFFLVLTEVALLLVLRWSPGYWLLGMRIDSGVVPTVDPRQLGAESLVTHIVATVMLAVGLQSLTVWSGYQDPIPYFGFGWGMWFAVIVSLLIGAAFIASSLLIFRNDVRGVWIGAGATAFGFLSVWLARGRDLNGWLRLELMRQAEARGAPVLDPLDLDPVLGAVVPTSFVLTVGLGVGLYLVWKRFTER